MKHIQTLNTRDMAKSAQNGGCGECQTSCQSACNGVREHSGHVFARAVSLTAHKTKRKGKIR